MESIQIEVIYAIIGMIVFSLIVIIMLTGSHQETTVTITSKDGNRTYLAKRTKGMKGNDVYDWTYYDEDGDMIEDETIVVSLFESFSEEDWYGDYEYCIDDSPYFVDTTPIENMEREEEIMGKVTEDTQESKETPLKTELNA